MPAAPPPVVFGYDAATLAVTQLSYTDPATGTVLTGTLDNGSLQVDGEKADGSSFLSTLATGTDGVTAESTAAYSGANEGGTLLSIDHETGAASQLTTEYNQFGEDYYDVTTSYATPNDGGATVTAISFNFATANAAYGGTLDYDALGQIAFDGTGNFKGVMAALNGAAGYWTPQLAELALPAALGWTQTPSNGTIDFTPIGIAAGATNLSYVLDGSDNVRAIALLPGQAGGGKFYILNGGGYLTASYDLADISVTYSDNSAGDGIPYVVIADTHGDSFHYDEGGTATDVTGAYALADGELTYEAQTYYIDPGATVTGMSTLSNTASFDTGDILPDGKWGVVATNGNTVTFTDLGGANFGGPGDTGGSATIVNMQSVELGNKTYALDILTGGTTVFGPDTADALVAETAAGGNTVTFDQTGTMYWHVAGSGDTATLQGGQTEIYLQGNAADYAETDTAGSVTLVDSVSGRNGTATVDLDGGTGDLVFADGTSEALGTTSDGGSFGSDESLGTFAVLGTQFLDGHTPGLSDLPPFVAGLLAGTLTGSGGTPDPLAVIEGLDSALGTPGASDYAAATVSGSTAQSANFTVSVDTATDTISVTQNQAVVAGGKSYPGAAAPVVFTYDPTTLAVTQLQYTDPVTGTVVTGTLDTSAGATLLIDGEKTDGSSFLSTLSTGPDGITTELTSAYTQANGGGTLLSTDYENGTVSQITTEYNQFGENFYDVTTSYTAPNGGGATITAITFNFAAANAAYGGDLNYNAPGEIAFDGLGNFGGIIATLNGATTDWLPQLASLALPLAIGWTQQPSDGVITFSPVGLSSGATNLSYLINGSGYIQAIELLPGQSGSGKLYFEDGGGNLTGTYELADVTATYFDNDSADGGTPYVTVTDTHGDSARYYIPAYGPSDISGPDALSNGAFSYEAQTYYVNAGDTQTGLSTLSNTASFNTDDTAPDGKWSVVATNSDTVTLTDRGGANFGGQGQTGGSATIVAMQAVEFGAVTYALNVLTGGAKSFGPTSANALVAETVAGGNAVTFDQSGTMYWHVAGSGDSATLEAGQTEIYLEGNASDYTETSIDNTLTLTDSVANRNGTLTINLNGGAGELVFADGNDVGLDRSADTVIYGGSTSSTLTGTVNADTIHAGLGTETLVGSGGADTYEIGAGTTTDTILNGIPFSNAASGTLAFTGSIEDSNLWFAQSGNNLVIDVLGTTRQAVVQNWFTAGASYAQTSEIVDAAGMKLDTALTNLVTAMATFSANNATFNPQTTTDTTLTNSSYYGTLSTTVGNSWHS